MSENATSLKLKKALKCFAWADRPNFTAAFIVVSIVSYCLKKQKENISICWTGPVQKAFMREVNMCDTADVDRHKWSPSFPCLFWNR